MSKRKRKIQMTSNLRGRDGSLFARTRLRSFPHARALVHKYEYAHDGPA
jgi:hypothetical protein